MTKAATNPILIRNAFSTMKDKSDLVKVLNIAKKELYGENAKPILLNNLTYYANHNLAKNRYSIFHIPKKSGGVRTIHAPVPGLKVVLKALNLIFQSVYEDYFDKASSGFTPGKSVVDNARVHTGKEYVYNLDLKDFFPSIELYRVKAVLMLPPFNLTNEREPLAYLIANLCCHNMMVERIQDGEVVNKMHPVLPQGAPTSPTITNIVCRRLDFLLKAVAKRFGVVYSRYADDITFSGNKNVYTPKGAFLTEVRRIIEQQRFVVNEDKVRLQRPWQRQEVTGITVNKSTNVERHYVKQVRQWLYLWETYGQTKAEQLFQRDYVAGKGFPVQSAPPLDRVIEGKLRYMKMVVGEENSTWRKLWERYTALTDDTEKVQDSHAPQQPVAITNLNAQLENLLVIIVAQLELTEI